MTVYYKGHKGILNFGIQNSSIVGNGFLQKNPEFDFFMNESPYYQLDAVMRIIVKSSNPDGYLARIVSDYKNKKIYKKSSS